MRGIAGWLSLRPSRPVVARTLVAMRDSIVYRGPDGEGLWISPDAPIGIGFRRLAIVDLSKAANQQTRTLTLTQRPEDERRVPRR